MFVGLAVNPQDTWHTRHTASWQCPDAVLAEPSKAPALAEPWFTSFNADVEFHLVMSPDDLGWAGLDAIGKKWAAAG